MKRYGTYLRCMVSAAALCVAVSCLAAEEETRTPLLTDEQVGEIAKDPEKLAVFIEDATADQVVEMLIRVITYLDGYEMALVAKRAVVEQLFEVTRNTKGAAAPGIIARVRGRVNPRLLPVIRRGAEGGAEAAPAAPLYPGQ